MSSAPTIAPSSVPTSSELVSKSKFARLLRARPQYRTPVLVLLALCLPIAVAVVWFIWFKWMPNVWSWAFHPVSWRVIPGAIALFFLASLPLVPFAPIFQGIGATLSLYIDDQTARVTEAVNRGSSQLETVEEELKATDKSGLVPLLRYSRVQLESYYRIALTQTQHSFRYSIIAMWIGFAVILLGMIVRVVDLREIGLLPPDKDVSTLAIIAGVVIELVSALFLWIYRSSMKQLTYFYNRQMYDHSVLMCYRIAESMAAGDEVKKAIAEKVLDKPWVFEQDSLPQGTTLFSFFAKKPTP
jgi:hypothetical protein